MANNSIGVYMYLVFHASYIYSYDIYHTNT